MCLSDLDCPDTQICIFAGVPWAANQSAHCDCSPWYGWKDMPSCLSLARSGYMNLWVDSVLAIIALLGCFYGLGVLAYYFLLKRRKRNPVLESDEVRGSCWKCLVGCKSLLNAGTLTMLFAMISLGFGAAWFTTAAIGVLRPYDNTLILMDKREGYQKYPQTAPLERIFSAATIAFGTCTALNISHLWIKVLIDTKSMDEKVLKHLDGCQKVVFITEFLLCVMIIILFGFGIMEFVSIAIIPFIIFITIVYGVAQHYLTKLLGELSTMQGNYDSPHAQALSAYYQTQLTRVRVTAIAIIAVLVFTTTFSIIYSGLMFQENGWQIYAGHQDDFGPIQVIFLFIPTGMLALCLIVMKYSSDSLLSERPSSGGMSPIESDKSMVFGSGDDNLDNTSTAATDEGYLDSHFQISSGGEGADALAVT